MVLNLCSLFVPVLLGRIKPFCFSLKDRRDFAFG